MYYLVLYLKDQAGLQLFVEDPAGKSVRAEFLVRSDAEMARGLVCKFNAVGAGGGGLIGWKSKRPIRGD